MSARATAETPSHRIIVMGVSGCGKSTVGRCSPSTWVELTWTATNCTRTPTSSRWRRGNRWTTTTGGPWLREIGEHLGAASTAPALNIGCSALKRSYRDLIRVSVPETFFVHLQGSRKLLTERMEARPGHFMPASLLDSQLNVLEPLRHDETGRAFDIADSPERIAVDAARWLEAGLEHVS